MAKIILKNISLSINDIEIKKRIFEKNYKKDLAENMVGSVIQTSNKGEVKSKILDDISIEFNEGDKVAIIGHNGSGKTTLLRVIANIYEPTSGEIKVDGDIMPCLNVSNVFNPMADGYKNIEIVNRFLKNNNIIDQDKINEIEEISELGPYLNFPIKNYSSGMLARLLFAIVIVNKSEILLIDEGINTGDIFFQNKATKLLKQKINDTKINIIASHSEDFLRNLCNKALVMKKGKIKYFSDVNVAFNFYNSNNY